MKKGLIVSFILLIVFSLIVTFSVSAEEIELKSDKTYIVLGPNGFTDKGIWTIEKDTETGFTVLKGGTNSIDSSSSPATLSICLPKAGTYKVYALSKDFSANGGSRYYNIKIGDAFSYQTGDHAKQGYHWQSSMPFTTFGGDMEFKLLDTKGNYARCAAIVITDDMNFNPTNEADAVNKLIETHQYKVGDLTYQEETLSGRPDSEIAVNLNGEWMQFDVDPILLNDRTMVPFRAIFEALGCTVTWDDENQTAIGNRNGATIKLPIGSEKVSVSGKYVVLDQPAVLKDGRTLVPLRFVAEALGAQVKWTDSTQTVSIIASVPGELILFTQESYSDIGTWTMESSQAGAFLGQAMRGTIPSGNNATLEDADTSNNKPAVATFDLAKSGTYKVWARSKDFSTNQQGDRFFQVAFNDQPLMEHKFGTHGKDGFAWACAGTIELPEGRNTLYVHDTSGFYARYDAILLAKEESFVPPESYENLVSLVLPNDNTPQIDRTMPRYVYEKGEVADNTVIENDKTKVIFYKVNTSKGQIVQNEIYSMHNGSWILTKAREEGLGYLVLRADTASYAAPLDTYSVNSSYKIDGKEYGGLVSNPYLVGTPHYFIPTDYTVYGNTVILSSSNAVGNLTANWTIDSENYPLVSIDFTPSTDGCYTVATWEGTEFADSEYEYALAPFRVQFKRVPQEPSLLNEQYLFTPMGTYTLHKNNKYCAEPVTKGVVFDPSWIPLRWVYKDNCILGISMHGAEGYRGTAFAPVMGSKESVMKAGQNYNMRVRIVSDVGGWFDNYSDITANLFDVNDYRKNYSNSLNQAIFNTRKLILDDKYGGWDSEDMAHYNMEGMNVTSTANSMEALQIYLLSEDETVLEKRAIPTLANALTRGTIHFNRIGVVGGCDYWAPKTEPDSIGSPISGFNANVLGGMYEMTRGTVSSLHDLALTKGSEAVVNAYGSIAPFANDLTMYKYTGDKSYLDKAVLAADAYLEEVVYAESTAQPEWAGFIYISYYPNLASLLDIYEATEDTKYLEAAEYVAQWMTTALWVPGIDGEKKLSMIEVNNLDEVKARFHYGSETSSHMFWAGSKQMRIGRENLQDINHNNEIISAHTKNVEAWIPSRVGLGIEQASTFGSSAHIVMQSFVGDFMKLAAYTGNDYYATAARNTIIGRFNNYDGYYRNAYITYPQETDYPYNGPDYTGIYWHHIPPYLAMLEDFLINQTFAWSGMHIEFPSLRQQGYAYFNSNQYGHEPGKFYDEDNMWAWLTEGIVSPDSIQIDYMAARKDGVAGIAFMNEDDVATTTTITLGEKFGTDSTYTGTADLYDKTGKIGTVEIVNGKFTLVIPAKSLQAIKIKTSAVKAPAFATLKFNPAEKTEIGATISDHKSGKGYTLQMSGDNYFAYVYTTYKPAQATSATLTYNTGNGDVTLTDSVYPYEFIVKVDDVNAVFNYKLTVHMNDGTSYDSGKGTLMTKKVSMEKGVVYKAPTTAESIPSTVPVTEEAKALSFEPTEVTLVTQGANGDDFRFVIRRKSIPFTPDEKNVCGLKVVADLVTPSGTQKFVGYVVSYEPKTGDSDSCVLTVKGNVPASKYASTSQGNRAHSWDNFVIYPVNYEGEYIQEDGTENTANSTAPAFDSAEIKLEAQGQSDGKFRFVVTKKTIPFEPDAGNVKGLRLTADLVTKEEGTLSFEAKIIGYEDRGASCVLIAEGNVPASTYDSTTVRDFYHWEKLTIHPAK